MPEFNTFDLGKVLQTAEVIKGMRREGENDRVRNLYMGEQVAASQQNRDINKKQEDRAAVQFTQTQQVDNTKLLNAAAAEIMQNPGAASRWLPQLQQAGILRPDFDLSQIPPEQLQTAAKSLYESTHAALAAFDPQKPQKENLITGVGSDGRPTRVVDAPGVNPYIAPEKTPPQFRPMRPEEVQAAGLPPGTSAQVNDTTGQISVISKRDATANLSQKDATTAKTKINTVKLARAQLARIREAFDEGRQGINAFGPGQGYLPTEAGKKFDKRVDAMRSTLTALTRVPGVGAMSDFETKLDQAKFPKRTDYEEITADTIQGLEDQLALLEHGYTDLLNGGSMQGAEPSQPQQPAAPQQQQQAQPQVIDWHELK